MAEQPPPLPSSATTPPLPLADGNAPPPLPGNGVSAEWVREHVSSTPPQGKLFPCLQCGAKVQFDPSSRSLKCPYCGHAETVANDERQEVLERDFEEYMAQQERIALPTKGMEAQVRCSGCGAMVIMCETVVTQDCPFCGTHLENQPETVAGMLPPESLLPFYIDLRTARAAFDKWLHGLWFAPSALKKLALLGQINGVYVPYWTYDAMTYTRYRGQRGDNYTVTETYSERDASGNLVQRTRTVTRIRWTPVRGQVDCFFDDVLVCGSKSLPQKLILGLEPWNTKELEPYKSDFLSGFRTERYVIGLGEGFNLAKQRMEPIILNQIRADIGGDHQRIEWKNTQYLGVTFKHCLLPVWVAHYRFQEKLFHILINGRTGKVSGERPYSWVKIISLILVILIIIGLIFFSVQSSSNSRPNLKRVDAGSPAQTVASGKRWNSDVTTDCKSRESDSFRNNNSQSLRRHYPRICYGQFTETVFLGRSGNFSKSSASNNVIVTILSRAGVNPEWGLYQCEDPLS